MSEVMHDLRLSVTRLLCMRACQPRDQLGAGALGPSHAAEEEVGMTDVVSHPTSPPHRKRSKLPIEADLPGVVGLGGLFRLATRVPSAGSWQPAGTVGKHGAAGFCWAPQPQSRRPDDPCRRRSVMVDRREPRGDSRREIVVNGMDESRLRKRLGACLLNQDEMRCAPKACGRFPNPFPRWSDAA